MPSAPASANPLSAAFSVCEDDTLIAGNAKPCDFAVSSISAYFSGVAMGMSRLLGTGVQPKFHPSGWHDNRPAPWFRLVDMDLDLREAFDQGFGPEPAAPARLRSGRGKGTGPYAGGGWSARSSPSPSRRSWGSAAVAMLGTTDRQSTARWPTTPTASPTADVWPVEEPARYTDEGELEVRPAPPSCSASTTPWATRRRPPLGRHGRGPRGNGDVADPRLEDPGGRHPAVTVSSAIRPRIARRELGRRLVLLSTARRAPGRLPRASPPTARWCASQGVEILEQRHPIELKDFVFKRRADGRRSAAGHSTGRSGTSWSATSTASRSSRCRGSTPAVARTWTRSWTYARPMYESGEGGR